MTYVPKIESVRTGECTQTIRPGNKYNVGDEILIHGWAGRPYHSKWNWRMRVTVTEVYNISIHVRGIHDHEDQFIAWDSGLMDRLAERDNVIPPTGVHLYRVLSGCKGVDQVGGPYQVIRWEVQDGNQV